MERQDEQVDGSLASEVIPALRDLARLSQDGGFSDSSQPGIVAERLLERLLALCAAPRGAILLTGESVPDSMKALFSSRKKTLRTIARQGLLEEEAFAILAVCPVSEAPARIMLGDACWIVSRVPIKTPFLHRRDDREEENGIPPGSLLPTQSSRTPLNGPPPLTDTSAPESPTIPITQPSEAVLLLGWRELKPGFCEALASKAEQVLSLVADVSGAVIVNLLLGERIHAWEAAAQSNSTQEMELLKADLLATVSHELRSPLTSIIGYAATLLRQERRISREERHEFLVAIQEASHRLERSVNRLLEISQLETGAIHIQRSPVDVVRLVREAIITAEQQATEQAPGRFIFHLHLRDAYGKPTHDEPLILADPRRLREILDHLLDNALNYSPEGGAIEVVIFPVQAYLPPDKTQHQAEALEWASPENGDAPGAPVDGQAGAQPVRQKLEICVCDHGIGIPPAHLERIFARFHRVDTRLIRETSGLGLGLTICKSLVEMHGGRIWAESCPDGGSAFHIQLPLDEEEERLTPPAGVSGA